MAMALRFVKREFLIGRRSVLLLLFCIMLHFSATAGAQTNGNFEQVPQTQWTGVNAAIKRVYVNAHPIHGLRWGLLRSVGNIAYLENLTFSCPGTQTWCSVQFDYDQRSCAAAATEVWVYIKVGNTERAATIPINASGTARLAVNVCDMPVTVRFIKKDPNNFKGNLFVDNVTTGCFGADQTSNDLTVVAVGNLPSLPASGPVPDIPNLADCNRNGVDDLFDIAQGTLSDTDCDDIPENCVPTTSTTGLLVLGLFVVIVGILIIRKKTIGPSPCPPRPAS